MIAKIVLLTSLSFAVLYPLCFLISYSDPLREKFHKFHLGLPNVVGGVLLVFILISHFPLYIKILTVVWKFSFLGVSRYYWKKQFPNAYVVALPCILGMVLYFNLQSILVSSSWKVTGQSLIAGCIFSGSFYAMNLGHWYLNVHGLPLKHLRWAANVFWFFLAARLVWDIFFILFEKTVHLGETVRLYQFMFTLDGFLLFVGILFGTVLPFFSMFFVRETIKLKNTQSTTGILYVILCAVLIGDLTYKYYLIKYGIVL